MAQFGGIEEIIFCFPSLLVLSIPQARVRESSIDCAASFDSLALGS